MGYYLFASNLVGQCVAHDFRVLFGKYLNIVQRIGKKTKVNTICLPLNIPKVECATASCAMRQDVTVAGWGYTGVQGTRCK